MSEETAPTDHPTAIDRGAGSPQVVVGVDGSAESRAALVYALTSAAQRGADLEVVSTYSIQAVWVGGYPLGMPAVQTVRDDLGSRVRALVDDVRSDPAVSAVPGTGDVSTHITILVGSPAALLVDASSAADLLVVGSRGRGAAGTVLLGSVALHCVTHAHCPAVVVHSAPAGNRQKRGVIVGVDGSAASRAALAVAVAEAARLDTEVAVVSTYSMADHWMDLSKVVVPTEEEVRWELQRGAEAMVDDVLAEHRAEHEGQAPDARVVVAEGPAAEVLVRWAADAELLVVGSRGHGEFRGLLMGSVALACAMHGAGPVMVVHPQGERAAVLESEQAGAGV
jgi:nucleotide-binding universal stress UspA family protein